jgi:leucyl aminopeptidase
MLKLLSSDLKAAGADVLVILCTEEDVAQRPESLTRFTRDVPAHLRRKVFQGKDGQTLLLVPHRMKAHHLLLVGAGKAERLSLEKLRRAAGTAVRTANGVKATTLAFALPHRRLLREGSWEVSPCPYPLLIRAMGEAAILANYRFQKYISSANGKPTVRTVTFVADTEREAGLLRSALATAETVASATVLARDLTNAPANEIGPEALAARARAAGKASGFRVRVLNERQIRSLGMGGLTGVSSGSHAPPRFIIMDHNPAGAPRGTVVLIGKGVTFDSGGISIKPSAGMAEMKMDMAGAAAVIGTMSVAARLKFPFRLVGLVPATENMPGGSATRPGDILRHLNGLTSEVDNTDAEGRLILADALAYANRYSPDLVIDLATLTGAVVVALGHVVAGMLGNDQEAIDRLQQAGLRTYERGWQLPLYEEYERLIKSEIADVKNVGGRWAGAITGAMFLKKFIGKWRWVHLDIAGTAMLEETTEYSVRGGSGFGVRLLTEFLRSWKKPRPWRA